MPTHLDALEPKCRKIQEHLERELASIRTGRATPSLIEHIAVQAYGTSMPLVELASISVPDARTLIAEPWDKSLLKEIERGLQGANTGCGIAVDKDLIRLTVPALTAEMRETMKKHVHKELEKAKVSLRSVRDGVRGALQAQEKSKEISEDDKFRQFELLDKAVKKWQEEFETLGEKKVKELEF